MFTRFKRETTRVFLDPEQSDELLYEKGKKIDLILSPALYWVKKLKLPVKSVRDVKKLLPSIFEDSLPEADYSYYAYKSGEEFFLFAYEDKKIFDLLSKKKITFSDIASVHFAQSEFTQMSTAFCVNEKECLYIKDELLLLVPSAWIDEKNELDLESLTLSKHTIKLQQFGHIVNKTSLYKIAAILLTLALILLLEIFITSVKKDQTQSAREEIFSKYKLQPTMFQNQSILDKYTLLYERQKKLREYMAYFLTLKLQKSQKITLLEYKNNLLNINISGFTQANASRITKELESRGVSYKTEFSGDTMRVEMKI